MSKRVSNKNHPRKTPARSKVRFGWRRKLAAEMARRQQIAESVHLGGFGNQVEVQ